MGYGVMVTQQILVLFFQVRILVAQRKGVSVAPDFCGRLDYGVMVTQQILVLFFQVRILVVQHEAFLMEREAFYAWRLIPRRRANGFLSFPGILQKIFHLSGYIVSLFKTSILCPEGCTGHLQPKLSPSLWRTGKGLP